VIENEAAARAIAEKYLDEVVRETPGDDEIVITVVREYQTSWVVGYNTRSFVETGDHNESLAAGPIIINRVTGIPRMGTSALPAEQQLDPAD
jgi:hypothetical protein